MPATRSNWLYYITHVDNVPSMLDRGILSHSRIKTEGIRFTPIYDEQIVSNRQGITTPDGRSLWDFANLYFQARNPMLFRVLHEKSVDSICVLAVRPDILNRSDLFITTGNAAHSESQILPAAQGKRVLSRIRKETNIAWWKQIDGTKRKIMAECLVPDLIPRQYVVGVYVANSDARDKVRRMVPSADVEVIPEPKMFFRPVLQRSLTSCLSLADGDMFFSGMQTLTVSVNCVGVMGKGLASRAKYQFPEVYVNYQDLCRRRKLQLGKPVLLKLEFSFDRELADEPDTLPNANTNTWFLLFATKHHWRERASIEGIERGLQWIQQNYKAQGIKSLAVPALGCGLGWLEWQDVGPLLCKSLSNLDIPVMIYLPTEKKVPADQLTKEFLLG